MEPSRLKQSLPLLHEGSFFVVAFDHATGTVLNSQGQYWVGPDPFFPVFHSYEAALDFSQSESARFADREYGIYDHTDQCVVVVCKEAIIRRYQATEM